MPVIHDEAVRLLGLHGRYVMRDSEVTVLNLSSVPCLIAGLMSIRHENAQRRRDYDILNLFR